MIKIETIVTVKEVYLNHNEDCYRARIGRQGTVTAIYILMDKLGDERWIKMPTTSVRKLFGLSNKQFGNIVAMELNAVG